MKMKNSQPLVSVVMPVYNVERYLAQAIESVLGQTYKNIELIAVNDGSTDGSGAILDEYKKRDARLTVVHQENQGVVAASNRGAEIAKGVFIARQDSDDISFARRIELQVTAFEKHPKVSLVCGGFEGCDEDDEFIYRDVLPANDEDIKRALFLRNPIGHGSTMYRRETFFKVGGYGANGDQRGIAEDYELFLRLASEGEFLGLESSLYHWRINRKGITSTQNKLMADIMKAYIADLWKTNSCPRVIGSSELRKKGKNYVTTYKKRGVGMKEVMLADNAQMAVKMMKHGHPLKGIHQVFSVAFVGRSGIVAILKRIKFLYLGTFAAVRRRMQFK